MRLRFAWIADWQSPVVRVHLIAPWRAHLGDHAGHCIHHHCQRATDYLFAELPGFNKPLTPAIETLRGLLLATEIGHNGWRAGASVPAGPTICRLARVLCR